MSCINVPPLLVAPVLDQKAVQDIQSLLTTEATWIDKVFGITRVGVTKTVAGTSFKYPQVWAGNTSTNKAEYLDIRPDDSLSAYSFFEIDGEFEFGSEDDVVFPISLIVWYNLPKLNGQKTYDYSRELAADILKILNTSVYAGKISKVTVDFITENIFSKYSLSQEETQYLMYPYGAFKISFNLLNYIQADCFEEFVKGTPECEN